MKRLGPTLLLLFASAFLGAQYSVRHKDLASAAKHPRSAGAKRFIEEEIQGKTKPFTLAEAPAWADPRLASMLIFDQEEAYGEYLNRAGWTQVAGGDGQDWLLVGESQDPQNSLRRFDFDIPWGPPPERIALVRFVPSPTRPTLHVLGTVDLPESLYREIPCPSSEQESRDYPNLTPEVRWIELSPGNRALELHLEHQEGYAGGGGGFRASVLLALEDGNLRRVAAFMTSYSLLLAGEWHSDGSREHIEQGAEWGLKVGREKTRWPSLLLPPKTPDTRGGKLTWDPNTLSYVLQQDSLPPRTPKRKPRKRG